MAGIYIHIPFCRQACHYCNFHFATSLHYKNDFIIALLKEIRLQQDYLLNETVETIYFGGGTPSLCTVEEIKKIIEEINNSYPVSETAEITLEANPDDISPEKLVGWKKAGVTRLSIGIQSFFPEDLQWMNRAHTAGQAKESLELALQYFDNITIDLIYGTPQLTNEKWEHNVTTALSYNIPHLSCYALTVEPKTPLDKMIQLQQSANINPDKQSEQFLLLMKWLATAGYEHYEISNFAKPGWRSRHNSTYWSRGTDGRGKKYLGLGPAAHSFNGAERQWNIANNQRYITTIMTGNVPFEKETLTEVQQLNEYIMTALRTAEGADTALIESTFNITAESLKSKSAGYISSGLLTEKGTCLVLTNEGKLLADGIAAALFY